MKKKISALSLVVLFILLLASCTTTRDVYGACGPIVIKDYAGVTVDSIPYAYDITLNNSVLSYKEDLDSTKTVRVVQNYQVFTDKAESKVIGQETMFDEVKTTFTVGGVSILAIILIYQLYTR